MSNYVLVVWTNMSDHPYTIESGDDFVALHTKGCEMEEQADNFERYEVMSAGRLEDILSEDKWYCWEEEEYFSSGVYGCMITDNQMKRLEVF